VYGVTYTIAVDVYVLSNDYAQYQEHDPSSLLLLAVVLGMGIVIVDCKCKYSAHCFCSIKSLGPGPQNQNEGGVFINTRLGMRMRVA